ncbi:MAG: hypothetical protein IJZ47_13655, partial [Oscillospiraceae bacterium]|nr:hypothetical protein [Oscillospiraceae bacterium]
NEELTEFIWNMAIDGKAYLLETDNAAYMVVRDDITTKEAWKNDNKAAILDEMVGEEFDAYLIEVGASYTVELDDNLINKKYSPDSYKAFNRED